MTITAARIWFHSLTWGEKMPRVQLQEADRIVYGTGGIILKNDEKRGEFRWISVSGTVR